MGDLVPCEHQVAGYHSGSLSCLLKNKKGQILKPVKLNANPTYVSSSSSTHPVKKDVGKDANHEELIPVCVDERAFYELVRTSTKSDDIALKSLIPKYYGCQEVTKEDGQVIPHLILNDLAHELRLPCVMDIKLGLSQDYPNTKTKVKNDKTKYATQNTLGFCLTGVRVFHPTRGQLILDLRPDACKRLTSNEVFNALDVFCQQSSSAGKYLCKAVSAELQKIRKWMAEQRSYKIRGGSVLVLYDASDVKDLLASSTNEDKDGDLKEFPQKLNVLVKMIDFAHVFHACGEQDDNYLIGLDNFIDFFNKHN